MTINTVCECGASFYSADSKRGQSQLCRCGRTTIIGGELVPSSKPTSARDKLFGVLGFVAVGLGVVGIVTFWTFLVSTGLIVPVFIGLLVVSYIYEKGKMAGRREAEEPDARKR